MKTVAVKESYFWGQVKTGIHGPDVDLVRFENSAGVGAFDVNGRTNEVEAWIELKVFHGSRLHFRNSQRIWGLRREGLGGKMFILARKDYPNGAAEAILYQAKDVLTVQVYKTSTDNKSFSILESDLPEPLFRCSKPFAWKEIRQKIFGPPE